MMHSGNYPFVGGTRPSRSAYTSDRRCRATFWRARWYFARPMNRVRPAAWLSGCRHCAAEITMGDSLRLGLLAHTMRTRALYRLVLDQAIQAQ
jgi:hypothetical protein